MPEQTVEKVREHIRRHGLFDPGQRVVVGCSGGADSVSLLHMLRSGVAGFDVPCTAVYVDHGLRPDTHREVALVARLADALGARFAVRRVDVPAYVKEKGGSVQEAARRLRYDALFEEARAAGTDVIAVGHTQTDQAETLLMHLLRGAGMTGLAAMVPKSGGVVRPLLVIPHEATVAYCRAHGVEWFEDPSNRDDRYLRVRIRHDLIPHLQEYNPRIVEGLARTAEIARAEDAFLAFEARQAFERVASPFCEGELEGVALAVEGVRALSLGLARRVLRLAVLTVGGDGAVAPFDQVEGIYDLVQSEVSGGKVETVTGIVAVREYERLLIVRPLAAASKAGGAPADVARVGAVYPGSSGSSVRSDPLDVVVPLALEAGSADRVYLPWAQVWVQARVVEADSELVEAASRLNQRAHEAILDWEALALPLSFRGRRPGDVLRPIGLAGRKKVKDLLMENKVPPRLRGKVPLLTDAQGVVWVVGHAVAERAKVHARSRWLLHLRVVPNVVLEQESVL